MSGEILPTCTHCHAPAREKRISKLYGYDITLCPACDRRFGALVDWDNEQLLEDKATCPYCGYEDYGYNQMSLASAGLLLFFVR